jgi:MoaA/NifB/PqqE/SkfB family radical SAM enzyme
VIASRKKVRLVGAYLRGYPIRCSWQLVRRCDSLCLFCEHRSEAAEAELDLEACRRVAAGLSTLGSLFVSLSGGEPFLRSDLDEVVAALAADHIPMLTTHGFWVTPERARAVWQAGLEAATVTLHHASAEAHDARSGFAGSHARALAALEVLSKTRSRDSQRVHLKVRVEQADPAGLEELLAVASSQGATVGLEPAFPLPKSLLSPAPAARLREIGRRHANLRVSNFFLSRLDEALGAGVPSCQAGRSFLNVDHRGRVSKCVEFQGPEDQAGDLSAEAVADVLPRLRAKHAENTCRACWYASRGEVEALYTLRGLASALPLLVRS